MGLWFHGTVEESNQTQGDYSLSMDLKLNCNILL